MRKNKKSLKKATIGTSLLMSAVLLCGNTVKAHAQADLTPEESQKLTEFLATQPTNGARTSLGLTNNVSHSNYMFPGRNNFTSVFESRSTKTKLDKDYDFVLDDGDHAGETVHVKNWQDLECFDLSTAENHPDPSMGKFYFAKEVTFVSNDGTEFTERNVALPVEADGIERYDITAYPNRYAFDYPIEEADSRFTSDIGPTSDMAISGANGYWQLFATVNEEIPSAENGDTVHVYKKVTTPTPEPEQPVTPTNPTDETPTQPETPTNPVEDTPAVPNPTPEPETPGNNGNTPVEPSNPTEGNINGDNDGETTLGNPTDNVTPENPTPEVPNNPTPNPTPEPNVPVEETPSQPVNPTDETPVVPNNPTDNTVVPPTVEEKPVENTVSNKVEEDTAVNNTNSSTTLFTNLAMTVVSGIGLLGLAFKKKESK